MVLKLSLSLSIFLICSKSYNLDMPHRMKKITYINCCLLFFSLSVSGQTNFSKSFVFGQEINSNAGLNIQPYEEGYLVLGGCVNDSGVEYLALGKVDQGGNPEWTRSYFLENQNFPPDPGLSMVINDSCIYVGCQYFDSLTKLDIQLVCIDRNTHDTLWVKTYKREFDDFILQTLETGDDALVLITSGPIDNSGNILRLIKTDKTGNLIWEKILSNYPLNYTWQSCISADGNLLIGYTAKEFGGVNYFGTLTKLDLNGNALWTRKFNNCNGSPKTKVAQLQNGDIAFAWALDTFAVDLYDYPPIVYILDASGNIKTSHVFYHYSLRKIFSLRVLPDGDLLGIGIADGPNPVSFSTGGWLFRMSPEGEVRWQRAVADKRYRFGELIDATYTIDNGIIATGYVLTKGIPEQVRVWLLKLDANGCYESDCEDILLITPSHEIPLPNYLYKIYPNPISDYFYIEGLTGKEQGFEIFNTAGQIVVHQTSFVTSEISVADLPPGVYIVKIKLADGLISAVPLVKL